MASLRRIILIQTHLPGVVELSLDGHTNICGTNASGKTTLQRLVPVFYGELPSKVVPRTRKKFDEFYLPKTNSYLIYEYQREEGGICQVVLTSSAKDGVQYRFVDAPYASEQILVQERNGKINALEPEQWLAQLKTLAIEKSHKITATSEYRSIIQNDAGAVRANSRDTTKLRQLAARYSLAAPRHKIRHIEKLVSAVHAKEGKMDTLKTMLAAIFEEDGLVQPTTRVKNTKAREWIKQMRQSMRLEGLQAEQLEIEQLDAKLNDIEIQLLHLRPLLIDDLQISTTAKADLEQKNNRLKQQLNQLKHEFNELETALNSKLSSAKAEQKTVSSQLDHIQNQYDSYQDGDIEQLEKDSQALPLWRDDLLQQQQHYRILLEQYGDLEKQLNQQKLSLTESLERLSVKNRSKIKELEIDREQARASQRDKHDSLNEQYQQRRDELSGDFERQLQALQQRVIERQAQIDNIGPTAQEQEDLQLSDKRQELAQDKWRNLSMTRERCERDYQQARLSQDKAQTQLELARTAHHKAQQQLHLLESQLNPEQGSLRHYLRNHIDGWENTLGKVINQELLERSDLNPNLDDSLAGIYGVKLELSVIESPEYAQDEAALRIRLQQLQGQVAQCKKHQDDAETELTHSHQQVQLLLTELERAKRQLEEADQEVGYARESKQRLLQKHQQALNERRATATSSLNVAQSQWQKIANDKKQSLATVFDDHREQLLEFKADWEQEIDQFNQKIADLEAQVDAKRQTNKEQIKQLEHAFNLELSNKDIDPQTLKLLQQQIKSLQDNITLVSSRQDELREYRDFIEVKWKKQRPEYLEQETLLKSQIESITAQLNQQKSQYKAQQAVMVTEQQTYQGEMQELARLIAQLEPLVKKLQELVLLVDGIEADKPVVGDQCERLNRANHNLEQRSKVERSLKDKLNDFESVLTKDDNGKFLDIINSEFKRQQVDENFRKKCLVFKEILMLLENQQRQILEQGETIGGDLDKFFDVFSDINRKIAGQSKRLTQAVADDLKLDGISRSEVKIISTVDELNFWAPLKLFSSLYKEWKLSGKQLPSDEYIDALADVVELLRSDASYNIESLLRLELHLNEGGNDLVIKNDRQLLESSSHGMAYLILCKFLLAFTRLLRGDAKITIDWPIDEIGTLAYHNVEKLFKACDDNEICVVGAFPNPESDVLNLFKNRYLIDKQKQKLQRIEPKLSRIAQRLATPSVQEQSA